MVAIFLRARVVLQTLFSFLILFFWAYSHAVASSEAKVKLSGALGSSVDIYRVTGTGLRTVDPGQMLPLGTIATGKSYAFPVGSYYAVNSCSSFFFELKAQSEFVIHLRRAVFELEKSTKFRFFDSFAPNSKDSTDGVWSTLWPQHTGDAMVENMSVGKERIRNFLPVECIHPLTAEREAWSNVETFDLLPGQVSLTLGGRHLVPDGLTNVADPIRFSLVPLVVASQIAGLTADFFVAPAPGSSGLKEHEVGSVVAAPVGSLLWLLQGSYVLELNGSRREVNLDGKNGLGLSLGAIEIRTPSEFPMKERLRLGGGPPFAYINDGVLFAMDTPYLVFPGNYSVSLEGGDMRSSVEVFSTELTRLRTRGARLNMPSCEAGQGTACGRPPNVTLHFKQRPFVLMTVEPNVPFLVLEDDYEYGIEGMRGVLKKLGTSDRKAAEETLARVHFVWQVQQAAPRVRTDLVRLESKDEKIYGKSLDFLFNQPREVYVPPGSYELTYLVGDPLLERPKTRRALQLTAGSTTEVIIPIYSDKLGTPEAKDARDPQSKSEPGSDALNEQVSQGAGAGANSGANPGASSGEQMAQPTPAPELPTRLKPVRK